MEDQGDQEARIQEDPETSIIKKVAIMAGTETEIDIILQDMNDSMKMNAMIQLEGTGLEILVTLMTIIMMMRTITDLFHMTDPGAVLETELLWYTINPLNKLN